LYRCMCMLKRVCECVLAASQACQRAYMCVRVSMLAGNRVPQLNLLQELYSVAAALFFSVDEHHLVL